MFYLCVLFVLVGISYIFSVYPCYHYQNCQNSILQYSTVQCLRCPWISMFCRRCLHQDTGTFIEVVLSIKWPKTCTVLWPRLGLRLGFEPIFMARLVVKILDTTLIFCFFKISNNIILTNQRLNDYIIFNGVKYLI